MCKYCFNVSGISTCSVLITFNSVDIEYDIILLLCYVCCSVSAVAHNSLCEFECDNQCCNYTL